MSGVSMSHKIDAEYLSQGNMSLFLRGPNPPSNANVLAHTPGYPIIIAAAFRFSGNPDAALQVVQIISEGLAAVLVFLIAFELLSVGIAVIAALLVSLSPQLSFYSLLLLPDSLAVVPILGAIYLLVLARKRHHMIGVIAAGVLLGVSCWLRPNGLLLAIWLVLIIPILFPRGRRLRYAVALVGAMIITIAPITIRNYVVFHHFIPLSLGSGNNLLQGVSEYDKEGRFGLPAGDENVGRWEKEIYNRPDYVSTFSPDGIERERYRFKRGLAVITSHPFWYLGVMIHRATQMVRLERVPAISRVPTVIHPPSISDGALPESTLPLLEMNANGKVGSSQANVALTDDGNMLRITGDNSKWGDQFISQPIAVQEGLDYVLETPVKVEQGRSSIKIVEADSNITLGAGVVPDPLVSVKPGEQAASLLRVPFVSSRTNQVRVVLSNEDPHNVRPITQIGEVKVFMLGEGRLLWTRYLRMTVHFFQRFFLTAWMIPLLIFGIAILVYSRKLIPLAILFAVPSYYLVIHSIFHMENRYVMAVQYFNFILIAVALHWIGKTVLEQSKKLVHRMQLLRSTESA